MKISEVVTLHPSVKTKSEYDMLLHGGDEKIDDIIAFIMDDNNPEARRLAMLRYLDELLGEEIKDSYDEYDLEDFMFNQEGAPLTSLSPEEAENFKKDMGLPPYHLSVVEQEDKSSVGEYEVCQTCDGTGEVHWDHTDEWTGDHVPAHASCPDCEEGLKDITGTHKIPNFDDLDNA